MNKIKKTSSIKEQILYLVKQEIDNLLFSFNLFVEQNDDHEYRGMHKSPGRDDISSPIWDVTLNATYPKDFYSVNGADWYGSGSSKANDYKVWNMIVSCRNKPNKKIKIYRAVPEDVDRINPGDWVTIYRPYAKEHAISLSSFEDKKYHIISKVVSASDLFTDGNSFFEWGWHPLTK